MGTQNGFIQLYDIRMDGTMSTDPSKRMTHDFKAHNDGGPVLGMAVDPSGNSFASYHTLLKSKEEETTTSAQSVVKIWDSRKPTTPISVIPINDLVADIGFEKSGVLGVASGSAVNYWHIDTATKKSAASTSLLRTINARENIMAMAFRPQHPQGSLERRMEQVNLRAPESLREESLISRTQMLIVEKPKRLVRNLCLSETSPIAVSNRDGRIIHSIGSVTLAGNSVNGMSDIELEIIMYEIMLTFSFPILSLIGPSVMESPEPFSDEDISATMLRRARCDRTHYYSTKARSNIEMLKAEDDSFQSLNKRQLCRMWSWIERIEKLSSIDLSNSERQYWPTRGLQDSGVLRLLRLEQNKSGLKLEDKASSIESDLFSYRVYDSEQRR